MSLVDSIASWLAWETDTYSNCSGECLPKAREALHTFVCRNALQRRLERGPKRP